MGTRSLLRSPWWWICLEEMIYLMTVVVLVKCWGSMFVVKVFSSLSLGCLGGSFPELVASSRGQNLTNLRYVPRYLMYVGVWLHACGSALSHASRFRSFKTQIKFLVCTFLSMPSWRLGWIHSSTTILVTTSYEVSTSRSYTGFTANHRF